MEITEERLLFRILLASPLFMSEASHQRMCEWATRGGGKERLQWSLMFFHFYFAQMKWNAIGWKMTHHQLILIDDIPGSPATNACRTFKDAILTEIGNIMITPFCGAEQDCDYDYKLSLGTVWLYFLPCIVNLNPAECVKRQIRGPRRGCQENITILNLTFALKNHHLLRRLNLTTFVGFESFPTTKSHYPSGCVEDRSTTRSI